MSDRAHRNKASAAGNSSGSFWKYYFPHSWSPLRLVANPFFLVLFISLLVARFENSRIVVEMQSWSLDWFWGAMHRVYPQPQTSKDIFIVSITDSDYRSRELFDSRTPLKPEKIKQLLQVVLRLGPKVVGIDLDTKDPTVWSKEVVGGDCKVENGVPAKIFSGSSAVVVWARMPVEVRGKEATENSDTPIQLYQVLGGCAGHDLDDFSGVPRFPLDADGVVRRYVGEFEVDNEPPVGSFARAIAEKYCVCLRSNTEEKILNFARKKNFLTIASSALIPKQRDGKEEEDSTEAKKEDFWKRSVRGKIVLIGGEFEDARDTHDTTPAQVPLPQPVYGIELNAMAIDSDIHGGAVIVVPRLAAFLSDMAAGTLFVWIFFRLVQHPSQRIVRLIEHRPAKGIFSVIGLRKLLFFAATFATLLAAIGVSLTLLLVASCWMSFIPILIGANLHQYIEHAETVGEGRKEA
ncbi:MAG TPA: CHASE2 domain-containing protein [Candidatus Acidoferrum sp.]|nr:CHASE2 domain-containing protein [Candidatus Acidoferrum sp.]